MKPLQTKRKTYNWRWSVLGGVVLIILVMTPAYGQIQLTEAFPNLIFTHPVDLQTPADGTDRLFVVEQRGVITVFKNDSTVSTSNTFLDITGLVDDRGAEEGLLGLAFHPDYETNGYFYVDYTTSNSTTVLSRFQVSSQNPDSADPATETVLLEVDQPYDNHNGGQLAFGPDGKLLASFGDGGDGGDPHGHGQDLTTLLGSIIRIDIDNTQNGKPYTIPSDNPYAGNTQRYREEIYAYGLRNPWRFSIDSATGLIWAGDVGQQDYEEVDIIRPGENYGWNIMEGFHCFDTAPCDTSGLTMPVVEYTHSDSGGQSITGGYVYRGTANPELSGKYVFGDYVSGRIWTLDASETSDAEKTLLLNSDLEIAAFGTDNKNELYICAFDGNIYTFRSTTTAINDERTENLPATPTLSNFPNPFNNSTKILYSLSHKGRVTIEVFDLSGERITTILDEIQSPGRYSTIWNARSELSSGTYFIRMKTPEYQRTLRTVLLK
ncbi:MAG: PQQ-dependent sugar dehydrogenase [Candidatus Marinimicrobia bacterium]|nr:PQQ-dependent sugar dehydrogenase [Candidatus Neomarinimicrobiota bacterium]MCF7828017.1 PQQ-dependent sugar dehydrogenase [Candidatus Neomarinimicrobiota bacterium]MCF7879228.1 PQQ-dependent sugar dehydrogenase [Candidatus Neomarinimicrobiota bacterium]